MDGKHWCRVKKRHQTRAGCGRSSCERLSATGNPEKRASIVESLLMISQTALEGQFWDRLDVALKDSSEMIRRVAIHRLIVQPDAEECVVWNSTLRVKVSLN